MFEKGKQPYSCPKPETLEYNKDYSFTINPADSYQYFDIEVVSERIKSFHNYFKKKLLETLGTHAVQYNMVMEMSSRARLHYHGTIRFSNIIQAINTIRKLEKYCTYEIDVIKDPDVWNAYMTKQGKLFDKVYNLNNNISQKRDIINCLKKI